MDKLTSGSILSAQQQLWRNVAIFLDSRYDGTDGRYVVQASTSRYEMLFLQCTFYSAFSILALHSSSLSLSVFFSHKFFMPIYFRFRGIFLLGSIKVAMKMLEPKYTANGYEGCSNEVKDLLRP